MDCFDGIWTLTDLLCIGVFVLVSSFIFLFRGYVSFTVHAKLPLSYRIGGSADQTE